MIPNEKLSLCKCHHCDERFKSQDKIYSISSGTFDVASMDIEEDMHFAKISKDSELIIPMKIHFHQKCFMEVAGDTYAFQAAAI